MTRHPEDAANDSAADTVNKQSDSGPAGSTAADQSDGQDNGQGNGVDTANPESSPSAGAGDDSAADKSDLPSYDELTEQLASAREQLAELKDNTLRARAEMENIRRRAQNEVVAARKFAIEGFAQELLGVKDSLDQASLVELSNSESDAVIRMQEGLALTLKQLDAAMSKFAVNEVEAGPGVKFNPEQHQAISMVASEEVESNHIISVMQKGFMLKDRLLRPAMVVVAS